MKIAVVIPCYKVSSHICQLIQAIGEEVSAIFVVDDCCPEKSGSLVETSCTDPRVSVIHHTVNQGVGGAVISGYRAAIDSGAGIIVKLDGDGQMDPRLIQAFVAPILSGEADYTKGNRFYDLEKVRSMPRGRMFGNAMLSFMNKLSSGYWDIFDPTNGYTAIHADVVTYLPLDKISRRYFFETDLLFRLNTIRAVVVDVPVFARYRDEVSNLRVSEIIGEFLFKHVRNFCKRILYNYYLRDLSLASIELPVGFAMLVFGITFGAYSWIESEQQGIPTSAGTVMLASMPLLMGVQLILAFIGFDIASVPKRPRHRKYLGK